MISYIKSGMAIVAFVLILAENAFSQEKDISKALYSAVSIPDSLKENANAIVRYKMLDIKVLGPADITVKKHLIVTILNEKAADEAQAVLFYSKKYNIVNGFEMQVFDANGKQIKKYHKYDMLDQSAVPSGTIASDDRLMYIRHTITSYPATIEITDEINYKSSMNIESWHIQGEEQAVQDAYCHLTIANDAGFKFQNKNTTIEPIIAQNNKVTIYAWHASNLKAIKPEKGAKGWRVLPRVYFATNKFEFYGVNGDFSSWKSFGKWIQGLNADVCTLSPPRADEIRKMTANLKTDRDKAKFLYEYLQQSMRYVSVQLGIGGMKPFPADFVDQKKYGDCKALSNYMYALLKAVDIPANYAIINAGANAEPAEAGFARNSFNHAILCVPLKGDTTWLECTSNTQPFGKLSPFTENRTALLITEDGGKLVNTPKSLAEDNLFDSEVFLKLTPEGSAKAQVKIISSGEYRTDFIYLAYEKADEQKSKLVQMLNLKQPSEIDYTLVSDKEGIKNVTLKLDYDRLYDVTAGDKQFYRPQLFSLWNVTLPLTDKRKTDYFFEHPMMKSCKTTIDLPEGFEVETLPANQTFKFTYGDYNVKYVYDAAKKQIVSIAKFTLTNQVIPAAKYTELQLFMDDIAKAQNKILVIRKKA